MQWNHDSRWRYRPFMAMRDVDFAMRRTLNEAPPSVISISWSAATCTNSWCVCEVGQKTVSLSTDVDSDRPTDTTRLLHRRARVISDCDDRLSAAWTLG